MNRYVYVLIDLSTNRFICILPMFGNNTDIWDTSKIDRGENHYFRAGNRKWPKMALITD